MNSLGKKVGYLKGLLEGMTFSDPAQEKLLRAMADLLGELSDRVEDMDDLLEDLNDYVESIDDDLAQLEGERGEDLSFLDDEDFDDDDYLDELDNETDHLHLIGGREDEDDPEQEWNPGERSVCGALCPACSRVFFVDGDDDPDASYACPHCGQRVAPVPLTPENAPIAKPLEDDGE